MSGIAGFSGIDPELLGRMLDSMAHRGPGVVGIEVNEQFSLGVRRLAIVDIQGGSQPMYTDDRRIALVSDSEIYNAASLRTHLERSGHRFTTERSDTEVILRGYEEWGHDVVTHLTGMFAFALWDSTHGELFLARDRLGIKPLFYAQHGNRFSFASEIKAVLQDPNLPRREHVPVLQQFLLGRAHGGGDDTFFAGIKQLRSAHVMSVRATGILNIRRYWNPEVNLEFSSGRTHDDQAAEFAALHDKVVARHLGADVPVGASLSTGLASTGVVRTMGEMLQQGADLHSGDQLHTFSALVPEQGTEESEYLHEVEQATSCVPRHVHPTLDEFWNDMKEWIWFQEEPTAGSSTYASYCVYRAARQEVKVILTGTGGDELLAGHQRYLRSYVSSARDQGNWVAGALGLVRAFTAPGGGLAEALPSRIRPGRHVVSMLPVLIGAGDTPEVDHGVASHNLNAQLARDVLSDVTPTALRQEDRNAVAFSLEARFPLLDHELVEHILKLPIDQKFDRGGGYAIYRRAMRGRLPERIRRTGHRSGARNLEASWIRGRGARMRAIFASPTCRGREIYDSDCMVRDFDAWMAGDPGDPLVFWRAMVAELWMQRYLDQPVGVAA